MGSLPSVDLRMFQQENRPYGVAYANDSGHMLSAGASYQPDNGGQWLSDVDMGTPSTVGFSGDAADGYHNNIRASDRSHLQPPQGALSAGTPGSVPDQQPRYASETVRADQQQRPTISRSVTAPEARQRRSTVSASDSQAVKRAGTSEDGDEDYVPGGGEEGKPRGRKRQRIPHTAVERRYRENLNAHLDRLRQTIPSLAARGGKTCDGVHEGVKPSKCEILNGAIEHIGSLSKENDALRNEVKLLRARFEEVDRYRGYPRGSAFGA